MIFQFFENVEKHYNYSGFSEGGREICSSYRTDKQKYQQSIQIPVVATRNWRF